jgi:hypothetical protein
MNDQVLEKIEDLGLDADKDLAAAQLAPARVEDKILEAIQQDSSRSRAAGSVSHRLSRKNQGFLKVKSGGPPS